MKADLAKNYAAYSWSNAEKTIGVVATDSWQKRVTYASYQIGRNEEILHTHPERQICGQVRVYAVRVASGIDRK